MIKIRSVQHALELAKQHRYILINDERSIYLCTPENAELFFHVYMTGQSEPDWEKANFWLDVNKKFVPATSRLIAEYVDR